MKIVSSLVVGAALAVSSFSTGLADAPVASSNPVQIDYCHLFYASGLLTKTVGPLQIKFTNEGAKTVTVVRFVADLDGNQANIRDAGSFAPGITIDHKFKDLGGSIHFAFSREPQPKCHVAFVKFDDGSIWSAPEQTPETPAPASSTQP